MTHWLNVEFCLFTKIYINLCKVLWPICRKPEIVKLTGPLENRNFETKIIQIFVLEKKIIG